MKIKTLILVILLSLLAFYNSAVKFDEENYDAYYNGIFATERIGISLNITANSPSQNSDILESLNRDAISIIFLYTLYAKVISCGPRRMTRFFSLIHQM